MAMDFMERLVPSAASVIVTILLFSCHANNSQELRPGTITIWKYFDSTLLSNRNGIVYLKEEPFSGILYQFYPDGTDTALRAEFRYGKEDGERVKFYTHGRIQEQRFFSEGRKTDTLKTFWEDGKLQASYPFLNDEYEGTCREWNKEGRLIRELHYHQGHEEGWQRQWYDNGKIRTNYLIKNGRRYGLLGTKNCVNVSIKKK